MVPVSGLTGANIGGLFTLHVSADDAEYLAKELGGGDLSSQDLQELGSYGCYAARSRGTDA